MKDEIIQFMTEVLELDAETAQDFYVQYLESLETYLGQMKAALASGDFAEIRMVSHTIIGTAGNVRASKVEETAKQLNLAAKASDLASVSAYTDALYEIYEKLKNAQ